MKQFLLATALIALTVAAFTGYSAFAAAASANAAVASLGDLSSFRTIITDVQSIASTGDLAAAKARIKDFEIAWDDNETGLKPMDPAHWREIDDAADGALTALRTGAPDPAQVTETLVALQSALQDEGSVTP